MREILDQILKSTAGLQPELILFGGILLLTLFIAFTKKPSTKGTFEISLYSSLFIVIIAAWATYCRFAELKDAEQQLFSGMLLINAKVAFFQLVILAVAVIGMLHALFVSYHTSAEYFIFLLSVVFGTFLLSMSNHFMSMYLFLELVSISSYILIAIEKKALNFEAAIKYLSVGAIISAVMLYGISFIYGLSGTLSFENIPRAFEGQNTNIVGTLVLLAMAGLFFKMSAAPFHIWAPDAYEKAPTPALSFLSVAPKIAAFLVIYRLVTIIQIDFSSYLALIILGSILIGNFAAIWQKDAKRMLAYSGIAHAGFILIGLLTFNRSGLEGSEFYLLVYAIMNPAAFLLIDLLKSQSRSYDISSFAGLGSKHILLGILSIIVVISLIGIPPTAGFTAKFLIFTSLITEVSNGNSLFTTVLVFGILNTAVALFYYLKIPYFMFMKEGDAAPNPQPISRLGLVLLSLLVVGLVYLFFVPVVFV